MSCYKLLRPHLLSILQEQSCEDAKSDQKTPEHDTSKVEVVEISDEEPLNSNLHNPEHVQCPVCSKFMAADHLQKSHLDYCLKGETEPVDSSSKLRTSKLPKSTVSDKKRGGISLFFQSQKRARPSPPPKEVDHQQFYFNESHKHNREAKRLPKIDFSSLATSKVKEKLAALKLATQGSRTELELRYNQYYLFYNSNIDLNRPLSDLELRQKLNQWEKSHQGFVAAKGLTALSGDSLKHKALSDKDFPTLGWLAKYKKDFSALVTIARASHLKRKADVAYIQELKLSPLSVPDSKINLPDEEPRCHETNLGSIPSSPGAGSKICDLGEQTIPVNERPELGCNFENKPKILNPGPSFTNNESNGDQSDEELFDFSKSVLSSST